MHPTLKRVFEDVAQFGWHVVGVTAAGQDPAFAFTVGLFATYAHPELLVFGLPFSVSHGLFTTCVERIKQGQAFSDGQVRTDILNHHHVAVGTVPIVHYPTYLGSAIGYYGDTAFPVLQLFWPDKANRFPWQPEYDASYLEMQRVLSDNEQ